jgi:hypothetical protein
MTMNNKITQKPCQNYRLRPAALDLLERKKTAGDFLRAAIEHRMLDDALAFITQWLPARQVVWWGCLCGWQVLGQTPRQGELALRAAVQWVIEPSETNRRRAEAAGYAADFTTPAGNLAFAAFHSGDNIAPAGCPAVKPEPGLAGATVANAVKLLLARVSPEQKDSVREQFVRLALALAEDKLPWPKPNAVAPPVPACPV